MENVAVEFIPNHVEDHVIKKLIERQFGKIIEYRTMPQNRFQKKAQIKIKVKCSTQKFFDTWSLSIPDSNMRVNVIPYSLSSQEREVRKAFKLQIMGLPEDNQLDEMEEYIESLGRKMWFRYKKNGEKKIYFSNFF